ncbi:hypothetical protein HMPREF1624_04073 [Sporothrix schenckii ATCC 58251]|uniref:Major facilitator superfamily (MFS) profile domain-containing protein n=1 Tax=Sporothrix schenckii (strain ATCC 58251 / de Perez 2211183) TaxID=1391915 RepID=U7PVF0_SPOS1|nr:hypothetical protein HMPREF1624_04073 [Sporothrix schenckii ATCC 58251]
MSFRERRRSTPLPVASEPTVDFQSATEAMQRAADAMIAATESFRQQFHQQDINTSGQGSQSSEGSGSGSRSGSGSGFASSPNTISGSAANRAASAASHRTTASGRRRAVSYQQQTTTYQPYRPPSTDAAPQSTVYPPSPAVSRPGSAASASQINHAYPPSVHRNNSTTPTHSHSQSLPHPNSHPNTKLSPRNPYHTYRAARSSTGSPAPPVSFHNNNAASHLHMSGTTASMPSVPLSEFYTVNPDTAATMPPGSGPAPALARTPAPAQPVMLNNSTIRLVELPGPLAMHPLSNDPQQPPRALQQQSQQQQQQQLHQQEQQQQAADASTSSANNVIAQPAASAASASIPRPSTSRASHASFSLMPKVPNSPGAGPSRRLTLTPPVAPPVPPPAAVVRPSSSSNPAGGHRPSMSSYIDLIEAASRLKRTHSYQGGAHAGELIPRDASYTPVTPGGVTDDGDGTAGETTEVERGRDRKHDRAQDRYRERERDAKVAAAAEAAAEHEPEPVLQIGRYTYVRSDSGDHDYRASLIRDDGSRRYTTRPVTRNSLVGGGSLAGSLRRLPSLRRPPPKTPSPNAPHGFSLLHEALFVLVVCLSQVLMLAGIAQALVPAQAMSRSFPDASPGNIAWYTAAYGLTSGTFVLPAGRVGDLFGHRRVFVIGFVWFAAWSLLAGFTPAVQHASGDAATSHRGTTLFIVCRAMQGIGPAMLVPNGQAMLGRAYPPGPRKNLVMCLFGASAPVGFVAGAVMSSLFAIYASWPWAFWTLAAVCVALAAVSMLVLPADEVNVQELNPKRATMDTMHTMDTSRLDDDDDNDDADDAVFSKKKVTAQENLWVRMDGMGILLGVAGLVLVNFAFNQAPIVGWATPYTYFLLILGLFFVAAFLYVEAFQAVCPLVPLAAMRCTTNFVLGCTATGWGCFSVWVYYAVQMFETLRGWSPLMTSAAFAPAPVTGLLASLLTGVLFSRGVKPHWVMLLSMFAFFVGSLLFATSAPDQLYWFNPFFSILIMPFGMDMSNPAAIILVSNSVRREHQGIAASLVVTFVNYAISLALGIAGSVEAGVFDADNLLVGYRAAQYFGLGLGGLGILFGTAFLCQSYLRTPPASPVSDEKAGRI